MDLRTNDHVVIGRPRGREGRSEIRHRDTRRVLGTVREVPATVSTSRWFAEDVDGFPIEGTFPTKSAAAAAVLVADGWVNRHGRLIPGDLA